MDTRVTDREVTEHLDEIIARVTRSGETLVVERDGQAVLQIGPPPKVATVADLRRFFDLFPPPDDEFIRHVNEARDQQPVEVPKSP